MAADNGKTAGFSPAELQAVLQTPEGKQIIKLLQEDGGKALAQASELIKTGAYDKAMALFQPIMETQKTKQLIDQINKKIG